MLTTTLLGDTDRRDQRLKELKYVLNSKLPVNLDIAEAIINVIRNTLNICS